MRMIWRGAAFVATTGTLVILAASGGCGSSRKNKGGGGGGGGGTPTTSDFNIQIQSADVPATGNPTVTFKVTDAAGAAIDLIQEIKNGAAVPAVTPGTTAPRFTLAQFGDDGVYTDYYEVTAAGKAHTPEGGGTDVQPVLTSATQASSDRVPAADPDLSARLVSNGSGVYTYTLGPPTKAGLDRTKKHTIGVWATRTLATAGDAGHPAHATFNFTPGGTGDTTPLREVVKDSACNTCHNVLEAHDRRTGTQLCITCHSPQSTDPESGNTVDFKVMIHKIHRGVNLPSVKNGKPYRIVGFAPGTPPPDPLPASAVRDFSDVGFPRDITDCAVCHQGAQAANWNTAPSKAACTSCHDNVAFDSSGTTSCGPGVSASCNHKGGPIDASTSCAGCHQPGEIQAKHLNPLIAQTAKFKYEILGVTMGADRKPVVQLHVTDPTAADAPYVLNASGGTPSEPWTFTSLTAPVSGSSRLFVDLGWPSEEYTNAGGSTTAPGQPVQIDVLATATPVAGQAGVYQVTSPTAVPADASFTVTLEGHPGLKVSDTTYQRIPVTNDVKYFTATGAPGAPGRREVVSAQKCNACHGLISLHGNNRTGTTQICAVCHNPDASDKARRIAASPVIAGESPIDFKWMIHAIHATDMKQPFTIIGFGGSVNNFPIGFPGRVDNCNNCHTNNSWQLPVKDVVHDTTFDTGASISDPADNQRVKRTKAVCTACHDTDVARTHADGMTEGGVETCQNCHGASQVKDIATVHRIDTTQTP